MTLTLKRKEYIKIALYALASRSVKAVKAQAEKKSKPKNKKRT